MKKVLVWLLPWLCVSLLSAQSLFELAQKEKARRAAYKGKKVRVVTNADLGKSTRSDAVFVRPSQPVPEDKPATPVASAKTGPRVTVAQETPTPKDQQPPRKGRTQYATQVLPETHFVDNPQLALQRPDGQYAQVNPLGFLDLEIQVSNGEGDDLAVYAKRQIPRNANPYMNYYIFAETEDGEWEGIGMGTGEPAVESFDLGRFRKIAKIRIIFRDQNQVYVDYVQRAKDSNNQMGIDAVEALH